VPYTFLKNGAFLSSCKIILLYSLFLACSDSPVDRPTYDLQKELIVTSLGDGKYDVTSQFPEIFFKESRESLVSGYPTMIVTHLTLVDESQKRLAQQIVVTRADFDLWEEKYTVQVIHGGEAKKYKIGNLSKLMQRLSVLPKLTFSLPPDVIRKNSKNRYFILQGYTRLNPISAHTTSRLRSWLYERPGNIDDSILFGEFITKFVNPDIPKAERVIRWKPTVLRMNLNE